MLDKRLTADPWTLEDPHIADHWEINTKAASDAVFAATDGDTTESIRCGLTSVPSTFELPFKGEVVQLDGIFCDFGHEGAFFNAHVGEGAVGVHVYARYLDCEELDDGDFACEIDHLNIVVMTRAEMHFKARKQIYNVDRSDFSDFEPEDVRDVNVLIMVTKLFELRHAVA